MRAGRGFPRDHLWPLFPARGFLPPSPAQASDCPLCSLAEESFLSSTLFFPLWLSPSQSSESNEIVLPRSVIISPLHFTLFLWPLSVSCGMALHPALCPWPGLSPVLCRWPLLLHQGSIPHHTLLCSAFSSSLCLAFLSTAFQVGGLSPSPGSCCGLCPVEQGGGAVTEDLQALSLLAPQAA